MKTLLIAISIMPSLAFACHKGYIPDPTGSGVCMEDVSQIPTNPAWVSNEKPPQNYEPEWKTGKVRALDAIDLTEQDIKDAKALAKADHDGKVAAGIIKKVDSTVGKSIAKLKQ